MLDPGHALPGEWRGCLLSGRWPVGSFRLQPFQVVACLEVVRIELQGALIFGTGFSVTASLCVSVAGVYAVRLRVGGFRQRIHVRSFQLAKAAVVEYERDRGVRVAEFLQDVLARLVLTRLGGLLDLITA